MVLEEWGPRKSREVPEVRGSGVRGSGVDEERLAGGGEGAGVGLEAGDDAIGWGAGIEGEPEIVGAPDLVKERSGIAGGLAEGETVAAADDFRSYDDGEGDEVGVAARVDGETDPGEAWFLLTVVGMEADPGETEGGEVGGEAMGVDACSAGELEGMGCADADVDPVEALRYG